MKRYVILPSIVLSALLLLAIASGAYSAIAQQPVDDEGAACGPLDQEITYTISRKQKNIGEQIVRIYDCGEFTRSAIDLRISVRIAFVKINSRQNIIEDWSNKRLLRLSSERTASLMGTTLINVSPNAAGWSVISDNKEIYTEQYLVSTAYWTAAAINAGALLNIDNGEIIDVSSVRMDERDFYRIERCDGKTVLLDVDGQYVRRAELLDGEHTEIVFEAVAG